MTIKFNFDCESDHLHTSLQDSTTQTEINETQTTPRKPTPNSAVLPRNLWLYVYDPTIPVLASYTNSCSSMRLFNAHGTSTVLLNNHHFKDRAGLRGTNTVSPITTKPNFEPGWKIKQADFVFPGVEISTAPYMNLVCDIAGNTKMYSPCHGVLLLNVPGFDSTIMNERTALSWSVSHYEREKCGQAGAYFASVQLVSWLVSVWLGLCRRGWFLGNF